MNVLFIGKITKLMASLDNAPLQIMSTLDLDEFKDILNTYKFRDELTLLFHGPLTFWKQTCLLKFIEDFEGEIVIYSPTYMKSMYPPLLNRFTVYTESIWYDKTRLINKWIETYSMEISKACYPLLLSSSSLSRTNKVLTRAVSVAGRE